MVVLSGFRLAFTQEDANAAQEGQIVGLIGVCSLTLIATFGYYIKHCSGLDRRLLFAIMGTIWLGLVLSPFVVLTWHGAFVAKMTHFSLSFFGVVSSFRWLELMFGTGPVGFDRSMKNFVVYFASPAEVVFNEKGSFQAARPGEKSEIVWGVAAHMLVGTIMLSIGRATNFVPFLAADTDPAQMRLFGFPYSLPAIYLQTLFLYCMLTTQMLMHRLPLALFGIETVVPMRLPLLLSTSVRDFWGRRWNLIIHRLMKRTFFTPFVKLSNARHLGGFLSFVVSGLFHEYMWLVVNWNDCGYTPGLPLLFFITQFAACAIEAALAKSALGYFVGRFPAPLKLLCTTLAVLPFGPLFLQGLHQGGMMAQCAETQQGLLILRADTAAVVGMDYNAVGPGGDKIFFGIASLIALGARYRSRRWLSHACMSHGLGKKEIARVVSSQDLQDQAKPDEDLKMGA